MVWTEWHANCISIKLCKTLNIIKCVWKDMRKAEGRCTLTFCVHTTHFFFKKREISQPSSHLVDRLAMVCPLQLFLSWVYLFRLFFSFVSPLGTHCYKFIHMADFLLTVNSIYEIHMHFFLPYDTILYKEFDVIFKLFVLPYFLFLLRDAKLNSQVGQSPKCQFYQNSTHLHALVLVIQLLLREHSVSLVTRLFGHCFDF